jgi:hypothetical protein
MNWKSILSGTVLVLTTLLFGFLFGGFIGGRVFGQDGMGWDRLADALGGMFLGVFGAVIVATVLVMKFDNLKRWIASAVFLAGIVVMMILFRVVPTAPMQ